MIQPNATIRYTNSSTSSAPPTTGWSTTGGIGVSPVPQLTFNQVFTEQSTLSLTNCTLTARTTNSITVESDSSTQPKDIIFGTNTLNAGDKFAVGLKLKTTDIPNGKVSNFMLGGGVFNASFPTESADEGDFRSHSLDQTLGTTHHKPPQSYTPNSTGLQIQNYTTQFPDGATMTIKDLRLFVL
jgi:hypothetical protein